ncbi:MAG TPA: YciI family protein [Myxococcales bacterium]|nr:YciI family protein [Myxococcales bacterium]
MNSLSTIPPGLIPQNLRGYHVGLLVRGAKWAPGEPPADLLKRHLEFNRRMIEEKKFVLAGPTLDDGRLLGLAIVVAKSTAEAEQILGQDPDVLEGRAAIELHPALLPSLDTVSVKY